jgi:hypothetical protein
LDAPLTTIRGPAELRDETGEGRYVSTIRAERVD